MHVLHSKSNKISMELYQKHQTYFYGLHLQSNTDIQVTSDVVNFMTDMKLP